MQNTKIPKKEKIIKIQVLTETEGTIKSNKYTGVSINILEKNRV
jgi:hypothetical protein